MLKNILSKKADIYVYIYVPSRQNTAKLQGNL